MLISLLHQYGRSKATKIWPRPTLVTNLSLPWNEIQHCSISATHHLSANKGVSCKNYAADTTVVSHLDSFRQLSHMAHASINTQEKIVSSSPSLTFWRSVKAFIMPKHLGHILQGFNNISTTREKTHCKQRSTSYPWFFLSTLWQTSFVSTSLTQFSILYKIINDNSTPFVNNNIQEVLVHYQAIYCCSTPSYLQGNG